MYGSKEVNGPSAVVVYAWSSATPRICYKRVGDSTPAVNTTHHTKVWLPSSLIIIICLPSSIIIRYSTRRPTTNFEQEIYYCAVVLYLYYFTVVLYLFGIINLKIRIVLLKQLFVDPRVPLEASEVVRKNKLYRQTVCDQRQTRLLDALSKGPLTRMLCWNHLRSWRTCQIQ